MTVTAVEPVTALRADVLASRAIKRQRLNGVYHTLPEVNPNLVFEKLNVLDNVSHTSEVKPIELSQAAKAIDKTHLQIEQQDVVKKSLEMPLKAIKDFLSNQQQQALSTTDSLSGAVNYSLNADYGLLFVVNAKQIKGIDNDEIRLDETMTDTVKAISELSEFLVKRQRAEGQQAAIAKYQEVDNLKQTMSFTFKKNQMQFAYNGKALMTV